ncbi:mandelate racemase/muconate lactonizing enzyme family protein [Orrella sp. JC864]|uniref:mandelate racemase/muconate lactonizing enzyme family protein n=1 Tax=Orrella sp. JC864 TaxID=3120298 RepID=UPI0012BCDBDE
MIKIDRLEAFVYRAPAEPPVQTSFGLMRDRPAVLVRVTDTDGAQGWGEIWCNFPTVGAEHRARLALAYGAPLLTSRPWAHPGQAFAHLTDKLAVLALQTGEAGPLQQMVAGLDVAMWDLHARRENRPLWQMLGGERAAPVQLYASGINPTDPQVLAAAKRDEGYRAFKLKVGFGLQRDLANLQAMRQALGPAAVLMADANQAWDMETACAAGERLAAFDLLWLEEPLRADQPPQCWSELARRQPVRLAGGENLAGLAQFDAFLAQAGMAVIQPDLGKWGGFTGCAEVARRAVQAGRWYCPHWLGAGIGLMASMHLKTAIGGPGYVEVDANPNPLRELLAMPAWTLSEGSVTLGAQPGLGVVPDLAGAERYRIDLPTSGLA